ncbi:MAG: hypothetical protein ACKVRN_12135 [Pyrinomonadaceae bacterium]
MTQSINDKNDKKPKKTVFFIDAEKFETDKDELSVKTLLVEYAKEDPTKTTLALRDGRELIKFTDLAQLIKMKDGMKFIVLHNDPTPVS